MTDEVEGNYTTDELLEAWDTEKDTDVRDALLVELEERGLFPTIWSGETRHEQSMGLYPDIDDPEFTEKLMAKQEFAESRQLSIREQAAEGANPCDPEGEFELTPVQRFIGRFLSPECPYLSALLFHGVGVGKTCAGITVAENYLRQFPRKKVFIVAPPTVQPGFRRTIFDAEKLVVPEDEDVLNTARGCTGNTYLKRTGTEFQKDRKAIATAVKRSIDSRYEFMGYVQFQNYIENLLKRVPKHLPPERREQEETALLRREFSGRLLIIDEAHNLRDVPGETEDDNLDNPASADLSDSAAGKKLTPNLLRVLRAAQGMKFLLMTGTPMYNSYREIIFLMNLMLTNDKKATISERDIFQSDGRFKEGGREILGAAASAYVSFMRGENPLSFPVRLQPTNVPTLDAWPSIAPDGGTAVPPDVGTRLLKMPFVPVQFPDASYDEYMAIREAAIETGNLGIRAIDEMVQAGNWIFPGAPDADIYSRIRENGFKAAFEDQTEGLRAKYKIRFGIPNDWLLTSKIQQYSPKTHYILTRIPKTRGVVFLYSRFIKSGGLAIALALEANGYTMWGRDQGLLVNGILDGLGRQCAMCEGREKAHAGRGHTFVPAKYVLLTGDQTISRNNPEAVDAARAKENTYGQQVKVIIGSQVASEGVDFRFVREIYVFDSWFHLNKLEQVIGRGVRTCSHALLKPEERNCTIYWLVNSFRAEEDMETADLYMYRNAFQKAVQVGRVVRALKEFALDCNLNRDAIIVSGFAPQRHIDAQGEERPAVDINDTPFTSLCDWIETCEYTCAIPTSFDGPRDMSTYDEYAARWREVGIKRAIKQIFEENDQPMFQFDDLVGLMSSFGVPPLALKTILRDILGSESFELVVNGRRGYLIYKNGYYLFQPDVLKSRNIPLALRVADIPVKRDFYEIVSAPSRPVEEKPAEEVAREVEERVARVPEAGVNLEFWNIVTGWAQKITDGTAGEKIPLDVSGAFAARYPGSTAEQKLENQRLEMVLWLYKVMKSNETYRRALALAFLELVWDDALRTNEQQQYLTLDNELIQSIGKEQTRKKGASTIFRYIDYHTGELKYMCRGAPCTPAIVNIFENDASDPLNTFRADEMTTGRVYGFMSPKKGYIVFKSSDRPPKVGEKPEKGGECAIVSTISIHFASLIQIGELLTAAGFPDFDLTDEGLKRRKFQNSARACMLKELILRWMDITKVGGKRWFYRPVAAYKTNHRIKAPAAGKGKK
jgi:Type III restriction enzyme, res subunit